MTYPPAEKQAWHGLGWGLAGSLVVHFLAAYVVLQSWLRETPAWSPPALQIALAPPPAVPVPAAQIRVAPMPPAPAVVPVPVAARRVLVSPATVPPPVSAPALELPAAPSAPAVAPPVQIAQTVPGAMAPVALATAVLRTPPVINAQACRKPDYPPAALRAQEEGEVTLEMLVAVDGTVLESKILRSSGFRRLDDAARRALALCRFTPGTEAGIAVQSMARIAYLWRIDE